MRGEKICSLCLFQCNDYKCIQDESGNSTEIYHVTVKYFDPMILTEAHSCLSTSTRVLCCSCWSHIYDFHEFQQKVLTSRTSLHIHETNDTKVVAQFMKEEMQGDYDLLSDKGMTDRDQVHFASDQDDEIPLMSLFQETRLKSKARPTQCETKDQLIAPCSSLFRAKDTLDRELLSSPHHLINDFNATTIKIESGSEVNYEISTKVKMQELSSDETHSVENDCSNSKKNKTKHRGRIAKKWLNDEKIVPSSSNTRGKLFGSVRKKKTELRVKEEKSASGKFKDKCKENDIFISKWKPILDCDLCQETVSNFDEMRDHFRTVHNAKCYIKCCERKFYRRYVLTEHIRLHVNPETHKCDICGKRSTTKYNLKLHKQVVHSESKQFECEICNRLFNQKPTLDRHLLTHMKGDKKFFCKECDRGYFTEDQLKYHIKTVHNVDRVCDQCGKTIHGVAALKKHLMEHAGIARQKYPCDICGVELVTNYGLRRHKAAYHHDGSTAYVCGICGKVASSQNALVSHKKNVHENGRRYKCTYCEKAFKRAKVLREHIATHTGVDLYQCQHCPQTFKVSANMHHHRKRAHPIEWEEGRKNRTALPKVNIQQVTNQVVL